MVRAIDMDLHPLIDLLLLVLAANGAPLLAERLLGPVADWPLDFNFRLPVDQRPLFGAHKTFRGIIASLAATPLLALLLGLPALAGVEAALFAMLGDLCSSFCKRRLGLHSGAMALGLDQIPESLFPALALRTELGLRGWDIGIFVAVFIGLELVLSRILFHLNLRKQPH